MVDLAAVLARRRWTWSSNLYEGYLYSANSPLGSCRGKKIRKFSENDADIRSRGLHSVDEESGLLFSKVPLTPLENNGEPNIRRRASLRIKKMSSSSFHDGSSRFPKLNDCAHFHYDNVELGRITLSMHEDADQEEAILLAYQNGTCDITDNPFTIKVYSNGKVWLVKRCYEDFRVLDKQLHSCIYDRRFSQLVELPKGEAMIGNREGVRAMLGRYLGRFSQIAGDMINCGPVLNWMELDNHGHQLKLDNHGNHVVASEESAINIPAVAAAHVTKRYMAQAPDEISLEVGDMISVIDMPPPEDTSWWRGKNGFEVGFFPRQCVEIISDKLLPSVANMMPRSPKPESQVLNKHGKLITFLRSFILARPTRRGLKQRGILRERVFGCDLGEHLLNCGTDVPSIIQACTEFIESNGVVDGIYRLSGVSSTVQWLRDEFDSEKVPDLMQYDKDIHCVSSVCKLYFRELPNPLLTYQLYKKFEEAATSNEERRLIKMHDTVQQLPPPHYRTLEFLIKHLAKMAAHGDQTGMNTKNLAIVWAPNLLRSKDLILATAAAFMEIKIQATVVEYLIRKADVIFNDKLFPDVPGRLMGQEMQRPKSLILSTPTKLLSLEEARARTASQGAEAVDDKPKYIEVGGGPAALPKQYHTVINFPMERKRGSFSSKSKKSPGWKNFFTRSGSKDGKGKKDGDKSHGRGSLRSVRSVESLTSSNSSYDGQRSGDGNGGHRVIMRRNSVACVDSLQRASSHDSFFEVDAATIAAATEDFLASTSHLKKDEESEDDIFIVEIPPEKKKVEKDRRKSSPLWIDQSISSSESNITSPKTPTPRDISTEAKNNTSSDNNLLEISAKALMTDPSKMIPIVNGGESPLIGDKNQNGRLSPQAPVRRRSKAMGIPSRRKIQSSPPMELQPLGISPPRDMDITEETPSPKSWRRKGSMDSPEGSKGSSVLEKLTRAMKPKTKVKREFSLGVEMGKQGRGTPSDGSQVELRSVVKVEDRDLLDSSSTQDANSQTAEDSEQDQLNLEGKDHSTHARPRSLSARVRANTDSDLFEDFLFTPETKFSLDTVLSEYDHIMEKYSNRALTPEFDTSTEEGLSGKRTSFPRAPLETEEYQPVPQFLDTLNANYNHSSDGEGDESTPKKSDVPLFIVKENDCETPLESTMESPSHNESLPHRNNPLSSTEGRQSSDEVKDGELVERWEKTQSKNLDVNLEFEVLSRESDITDFEDLADESESVEKSKSPDDKLDDSVETSFEEASVDLVEIENSDQAMTHTSVDEPSPDTEQEEYSLSLEIGNQSTEEDLGLHEMKFPDEDELDSDILGVKRNLGDMATEIRISQQTLSSQYDNLDDNTSQSSSDRGVDLNVRTASPPAFEVVESPFCTPSDENGEHDLVYNLAIDDIVEHVIEL
ncbi:rho GTPase-activating protein 32-like isoform X4 [Asterias rubens]|uniref:rho GTPase-activating protein 32-like isoform X4 n=1 Tax=Asterias rubens TaxID=7604 RepID=UPI00145594F3|nr:rho GTPase-activating protein 32-like isoform X4 [Asterias rubens]XP_033641113.1 rho GTPase-activating protein 32-like isoform X4 [Asterias rubens]XP_033641114.1 rho GTPase-activating protein 32-like isoform X4 [Asterias rubens]XP_033641115.1 rho GTPase-activating protein 32-like isoform X4 [Asterias rubens]XP_033641116.1 rho GTPase-activating protein 32-like isoform X4 [Asterias rubens]XP_033641117.1 rho GTPase-activating protein 32-like isoform X4 [Asterias rubens]